MDEDDAARTEIDKWIQDNAAFAREGAGESNADLNQRIHDRLNQVRKGYEDLLQKYPDFARAHLAYGSFLNETGEEEAGAAEFEKATLLDPKNPAAWNNLGNYHGHRGPVTNAFTDYARAIELNPAEPIYYQNLATTVYLFRKDAREFFGINEQQVFDKALELYAKALKLKPDDFPLATDLAQSYYGIKPLRTNDALVAWTNALNIAHDDIEREGVFIHLARIKLTIGRFDEAHAHLDDVTNAMYDALKARLERNLAQREHPQTNAEIAEAATNLPDVSTNVVIEPTNATPHYRHHHTVLTNEAVEPQKIILVLTNPAPALIENAIESTNGGIISTNEEDIFKNFMMPAPRLLPSPPQ